MIKVSVLSLVCDDEEVNLKRIRVVEALKNFIGEELEKENKNVNIYILINTFV